MCPSMRGVWGGGEEKRVQKCSKYGVSEECSTQVSKIILTVGGTARYQMKQWKHSPQPIFCGH